MVIALVPSSFFLLVKIMLETSFLYPAFWLLVYDKETFLVLKVSQMPYYKVFVNSWQLNFSVGGLRESSAQGQLTFWIPATGFSKVHMC